MNLRYTLKISACALGLCWSLLSVSATAEVLLDPMQMQNWEVHEFVEGTRYIARQEDQQSMLMANTKHGAGGYGLERSLNIRKTPWLVWRWKADKFPQVDDERVKAGDDFVARVYVIKKGLFGIFGTKVINYVFSAKQPTGSQWINPFTSRAVMIAASGNDSPKGEWIEVRRNLMQDWQKVWGEQPKSLDAIAIMTDADNSKSAARAVYGPIMLTSQVANGVQK
ncbi:DUF3047 domain-containing protein [Pelagibaculum spongiae]|uniref:DUF3047 domain-containing protein n=1 Tax=Pelagibaculum spongiae TaxID=2080658 RepID=A0A2V1GTP6_9GAMM|nr:DUF3047 domain-containing protein [Pelagibaculum spongiae]PVZ67756.1 hypothetical protein DC094_15085 [Pelagibaculum spongiae]